jgi:hypothetical protein
MQEKLDSKSQKVKVKVTLKEKQRWTSSHTSLKNNFGSVNAWILQSR